MSKTTKNEKQPHYEQIVRCSASEGRGIDDVMPETQHLLDRQIRHFPYEASGDGRDYGRKTDKQSYKRRKRQADRAICKEWPLERRMNHGYIQVEYDLNYTGGDYSDVGRFALIPEKGVTDENIKEHFRKVTGFDPVHIIHYDLDELYDINGDPLEEDEDE